MESGLIPGSCWRHYKSHGGNDHTYEVVGIAKHSETDEELVVYRPLYDVSKDSWVYGFDFAVRPLSIWFDEIEREWRKMPRFTENLISHMKTSGFTLVELIVTVSIIAIVSTVGLVSYSKYSTSSRDSMRIQDLAVIMGRLEEMRPKLGAFPMPESSIAITNGSNLAYQGKMGDTLRKSTLSIMEWAIDPNSKLAYTYIRDARGTKAQVLGYFEGSGYEENFAFILPETANAASLANRSKLYPVANGDRMWVIIQSSDYSPIEEVITTSTTSASLKSATYITVNSCLKSGMLTLTGWSAIENCY